MRQTAGTLNRTWLAVLGVLILGGGVMLLLQSAGILQTYAATAPPGNHIVAGRLSDVLAQPWLPAVLLVIGLALGVLALLWIIAQIPRKNAPGIYRLHHDGGEGVTVCDPSVLADAVERQVNILPGVVNSSVLLRGTPAEPDLTLRVSVNSGADIQDLLRRVEASILPDLCTALESPLKGRRVQIDVSGRTQNAAGTPLHSSGIIIQ